MNKKLFQKFLIVLALLGIVAAFKFFGLGQYLKLSYLKESREHFQAFYAEHTGLAIAVYMLIYIVITSLSLPGAAVMTLAGGALFGLWVGTAAVSFSSAIGATVACLVSRFLLRDWVQGKFGDKIKKINEGIEREGAFYLFTLRLIPVFPFWVINLVMGITEMKLITFYWVSQAGMLPGTLVYVNAGRELGRIESVSGIFSPGLIISFVILGIFPLAAKKILSWYRMKSGKSSTEEMANK